MANADEIVVEVLVATPERQILRTLSIAAGTDAGRALEQSGLRAEFADLDWSTCQLAVWGHPVDAGYRLNSGDRVEVLRPLERDPRDARRALAREGQFMGGTRPDED